MCGANEIKQHSSTMPPRTRKVSSLLPGRAEVLRRSYLFLLTMVWLHTAGHAYKTGAPNLNDACSEGVPGPSPVHGELQPYGQSGQYSITLYEMNSRDKMVRYAAGRQYEGESWQSSLRDHGVRPSLAVACSHVGKAIFSPLLLFSATLCL